MYILVFDEKEHPEFLSMAQARGLKTILKLENPSILENVESSSVSEFLCALGLKPQLKGFKYVKYILENKLDCTAGITTYIYPTVAKAFNVTPDSIERNIRHLIRSGVYTVDSIKLCEKVFGTFEDFPTNHQFLCSCSIHLNKNGF